MKSIVYTRYGDPNVLSIKDMDRPVPQQNELLIKVHAATVNRTDCATIRAKPFFMRLVTGIFGPKKQTPGTDFAGTVEALGKGVHEFQLGDRVFGFNDEGSQSHAEYLAIDKNLLSTIPDNISFDQATASLEGAHYAHNFINKVSVSKGDPVLVNGATGAIGSAAVQLLNYFGAKITAVCSTENVELVKSLGAQRIIDYTKQDFTQDEQRYNLVFDAVGKSSFFRCRRLLKPGGIYISSDLGFLWQNLYLPLITPMLSFLISGNKTVFPVPTDIPKTIELIKTLLQQGKFSPVIDKRFSLDNIIDAYTYVERGHKTGNVVIEIKA